MFAHRADDLINEDIRYDTPAPADGPALRAMAREAFADTFARHYDAAPFAAFLEEAYGVNGRMRRDLGDPSVRWRIARDATGIVGYAKLTTLRAPAPDPETAAMELQQLYVLRRWHGRGVAPQLMAWAIHAASRTGCPALYLTVFDHNVRAKRFYARYGFTEVGHCTFTLGDRVDDDRIWRRDLTADAGQPGIVDRSTSRHAGGGTALQESLHAGDRGD